MEQNKDAKHCKTFGDVCGEWLQFKESKLKISSYTRYEVIIDRHILPQFGDVKVDEYSCHLFEDGLKAIMDIDGIRLSRSTMNTVLYIVRAVIKYGNRHGYNKELEIEFECSDMGKVSSIQVLSNEEELRLISYLDSDRKNPNHMGIMMSLLTGMRIGEICAIKRKAVNMRTHVISVHETAQRIKIHDKTQLMVTAPKSRKSNRLIPMPEMVSMFMMDNGVLDLDDECRLLTRSELPYEPRTLQYAFKSILEKCEIPYINFHCLRHTFATNCVELGFDIKTLSELLGHSTVNFTLNRYVHSSIELKKKEMNLLDNKYATFH